MTRDEAITIRGLQLSGRPVDPALAAEAIDVIKATAKEIAPDAKPPQDKKKKPKAPSAPKKSDLTKAKRIAAALLDQETRGDRGNRILLANLQKAMPWWTYAPPEAPRLAPPAPLPGLSARRVPAPAMTYPQAVALRLRRFNRQPVDAAQLAEANRIVAEARKRAMPKEESYR